MPDSPTSYTLKDPSTGKPLEFNVPAPTPGLPNPQAIAQAYQNAKIKDAEKAVAAAIQFQGLRGYQQALQAGEPSEKALTRYAPMMFYTRPQAIGPAIRAVTPPQMTPFQQATIDERKRKAELPAPPLYRGTPGGGFVKINPQDDTVTELRAGKPTGNERTFNAVVGVDRLRGPVRLPMTEPEFKSFIATAPPSLQTNQVNTAIGKMIAPQGTTPAATDEVRRKTRDGRTAIFDSSTKQFIRYADD